MVVCNGFGHRRCLIRELRPSWLRVMHTKQQGSISQRLGSPLEKSDPVFQSPAMELETQSALRSDDYGLVENPSESYIQNVDFANSGRNCTKCD